MTFQFDADIKSVDEGIWIPFNGSRFRIAHVSNLKFQRAIAKQQQPYRRKLETGTLDPAISKEIMCRALSEGVLLDWDGVVDKSGEAVTYEPERGFTSLMKNPEFRDFVSEAAQSVANYREEEVAELGKS